jgi:hypothetical protein
METEKFEEFDTKYFKPKILLIDLPDKILKALESEGYNVKAGSFGNPYYNQKETLLRDNRCLPNICEQEIIFVDLTTPETIDINDQMNVSNIYVERKSVIDPRPMVMSQTLTDSNRILNFGGIIILFACPRKFENYEREVEDLEGSHPESYSRDNYSFLPRTYKNKLSVKPINGHEITVPILNRYDRIIRNFVTKYSQHAEYYVSVAPRKLNEDEFQCILKNKYGQCVGAIINPKESEGLVIVLPQISKEPDVFLNMLNEVLPELSPKLFQFASGKDWIDKDEYALDCVPKLKAEKVKLIEETDKKIQKFDQKIIDNRNDHDFVYRIITGTGEDLVDDIQKCLEEVIDFKKVHNIDRELEDEENHQKQEDLQICDRSPKLLVEVKGITGFPSESDMNQVSKYVLRRIQDWKRFDVRGVTIVNHFRNIPAVARGEIFNDTMIADAIYRKETILTTWDLFILIRGMIDWKWNPKYIQDLFYTEGRISQVPSHYKPIGTIVKLWKDAQAISIELTDTLCNTDRIGYFFNNKFFEEDILSLQLEGQNVKETNQDQKAGIKTAYIDILKNGITVYKVDNNG